MNHILYNISIVMLLVGMLMLTYYLTKAYNISQSNCNINNYEKSMTLEEVYNQRPSNIYKSMFNDPSIWQGYEQINTNK